MSQSRAMHGDVLLLPRSSDYGDPGASARAPKSTKVVLQQFSCSESLSVVPASGDSTLQ